MRITFIFYSPFDPYKSDWLTGKKSKLVVVVIATEVVVEILVTVVVVEVESMEELVAAAAMIIVAALTTFNPQKILILPGPASVMVPSIQRHYPERVRQYA